jgi:hypothetical protein
MRNGESSSRRVAVTARVEAILHLPLFANQAEETLRGSGCGGETGDAIHRFLLHFSQRLASLAFEREDR